jgi:hypothetical protein
MKRLSIIAFLLTGAAVLGWAQSQPQPPVITSPQNLPSGAVNAPYQYQFTATCGSNCQWTLFSYGSLPHTFSLSASGVLTGTAAATGSYSFYVQVRDTTNFLLSNATQFNLTITGQSTGGALAITPSTVPGGTVSVIYPTQQFFATGGSGTYFWYLSSGNVPPGLTFSQYGYLSGTPTTAGTYDFRVAVYDQQNASLTGFRDYEIVISNSQSGTLTINSNSPLPDGIVNVPYQTQQLSASGGSGSYTWSYSFYPSPPAGLTFAQNGTISGTPTASGPFIVTAYVQDNQYSLSASKQFQLTVQPACTISVGTPSILSSSPLPDVIIGSSYSYTFAATGGSCSFHWSADSLPSGLTLNPNTGALTGVAAGPAQTMSFNVTVLDNESQNTTTKNFTVAVRYGSSAGGVAITTSSLPGGSVGTQYSYTLTATGCSLCYWTLALGSGPLPPGLQLSTSGTIYGTPTQLGVYTFVVQVNDQNLFDVQAYAQKQFTLTIGNLTIQERSLPFAIQGTQYSYTLHASGGAPPYSWRLGSTSLQGFLLSVNASDTSMATLAGTPQTTGTFDPVPVTVTDSTGQSYTFRYSLFVAAPLSILTSSLPNTTIGAGYAQTLQAGGGQSPYSWRVTSGNLPPGIQLDASTGRLSGSATQNGTFNFTVQVTDAGSRTAAKPFTIVVGTPLQITTASLPDAAVNAAYAQTLSVTGGQLPVTWTLDSGSSLPPGLSLSAQGVINGIPTAAGSYSFTVVAKDASNGTDRKTFTLLVTNPLTITTVSAVDGVRGTAYSQAFGATGGTPAYTWSVASGSLPPGLQLDSATALISGTPAQTGIFTFTLQVNDKTGQSASRNYTIAVLDPLTITTGDLSGAVGAPFNQTLAASGGSAPYTWSANGLPAGLTLNATTGAISGMPSDSGPSTVGLTVTDSGRRTATKTITINIAAPPSPRLNTPDTAPGAGQISLSLTIAGGYPADIAGTLTLTFASSVNRDDQSVRFSNGSRTVNFTIPAGSTQATFTGAPGLAVLTGTTAGTISLTINAPGVPAATQRITINPGPPVLTSVQFQQASGALNVVFSGYSVTGDMTSCAIHFNAATGSNLQAADFTVQMGSAFSAWYGNSASLATGTQFTATVPFSISNGTAASIVGGSVNCTNSKGTSNTVSP